MTKLLFDPMKHPYWIQPQSAQWHANVSKSTGEYKYPWKSEFDEPRADVIFMDNIRAYLYEHARILDVGCGHGEFTAQFAHEAGEIVGMDVIQGYITSANEKYANERVRFVVVDADHKLPFPDDSFDIIYSKKGPWLFHNGANEGHRIMKPGGIALGLYHCGTDGGLRSLFPGLYSPFSENHLDELSAKLDRQLCESRLEKVELQIFEEVEYLLSPEDVLIKKCFGQSEELKEVVWRECLQDVEEIFHRNSTAKGLRVVNYHALMIGKAI